MEALCPDKAQSAQLICVLFGFDALCNEIDLEVARKLDHDIQECHV